MRDHRTIPSLRTWVCGSLLLGVLLPLSGCGDGKLVAYPVTGTLLVDGRPAEGAVVTLIPINGSEEFMHERPFSEVDAEGKFELTTFLSGDGAPAGDYKVTVLWTKGARPGQADRLGARYATPDRTSLTATVESGPNTLPPIELSSK